MKLAILFGGLAGAALLIGQGDDDRVFVNFQEVMIPMRDGVRLQTVLLTPKNAQGALPFLIDRTPYGVPGKEAAENGLPAGKALKYAIDLHTNAHAFLKGRRIMVQVQITWFPVYHRNPQKFLPGI